MPWIFAWNTFAALLVGIAIGIERQFRHHAAGLKTNALVSVGSAIYVGLSLLMDHDSSPTRIAAQIVSGLGFLGAGVILREGLNVHGLNTAATIWCSGAVGSLCGAGFVTEAMIGTSAILGINVALLPVTKWIDSMQRAPERAAARYHLRVECEGSQASRVRDALLQAVGHNALFTVTALESEHTAAGHVAMTAILSLPAPDDRACERLTSRMSREPDVSRVSWQRDSPRGE